MIWFIALIGAALPTYLVRFTVGGIPSTLLEILIYLAVIITLIRARRAPPSPAFRSLTLSRLLPMILFLIASIVGVIIAPDTRTALGIWKGWIIDPILLGSLIVWHVKITRDISTILLGLSIGATLIAVWAIAQTLGWSYLLPHQRIDPSLAGYLDAGRALGPFESPNYLAMYLAPIIGLTFGLRSLLYPSKRLGKFWVTFSVLAGLAAIILSRSFGAWLGLLVALAVTVALAPRLKVWRLVIIPALVISIIGAALILIDQRGSSWADRLEVWAVAQSLLYDHPVWGIGLGAFPDAYHERIANIAFPPLNWLQLHPHNLVLAVWLQMGILGLVSFIWIIAEFLARCLKALRHQPTGLVLGILAAMVTIIGHGLTDTTYWKNDLAALFWIVIALSQIIETQLPNKTFLLPANNK